MNKEILLGHGSGGKLTHELIKKLFIENFNNPILQQMSDSAICNIPANLIAFTTDSYVVNPIVFPGGDIGKLAVCGTVNDLAVTGAKPLYISSSFIIEEGFPYETLEQVVISMKNEAENAGVLIVTGDTKVVNRGECDKLFINTSGIGVLDENRRGISAGTDIKPGDKIIINGQIALHGLSILSARSFNQFNIDIKSDCASLNHLIAKAISITDKIHFMRDATRGGLASVLCEITEGKSFGILLDETKIPIPENASGFCELLGFDPLYIANEGKVVMIVDKNDADTVLKELQKDPLGIDSAIIGEVVDANKGKVVLNTKIGGKRYVEMLSGEQLPRIC